MEQEAHIKRMIIVGGTGVLTGALFSFIFGDLDAPHYVVELLSILPLELPFVVAAALVTRMYGWRFGLISCVLGIAAACALFFPDFSMTPVVYLKTALMGLIIGETRWFARQFTLRITAVSLPGFLLALVLGIALIHNSVPDDTLQEIRQEAFQMYEAFMEHNDAVNMVDNAMNLFKGFFRISLGVLFMSSLVLSWMSILVTRFITTRLRIETETVPSFDTFNVPFHAIWIFLVGLGIYLIEFRPLAPISVNIMVIMAGLYGLQGLAIVMFHMGRAAFGFWPRIIFWLIFFITLTFSVFILLIIGIVDNWINLRPVPVPPNSETLHEEDKYDESDS